jgi:hypothetical protein
MRNHRSHENRHLAAIYPRWVRPLKGPRGFRGWKEWKATRAADVSLAKYFPDETFDLTADG